MTFAAKYVRDRTQFTHTHTPCVPLSIWLSVCPSLSDRTRNSTHLLLFAYVRYVYATCARELVAKNYCTFVAFALLAGCRFAVAGFLLLVVSIYGKLLKLYGNLFASLSLCVCACLLCVCCVSFILFRYAYLQLLLFFLYRQVCLFFY